MRALLLSAVAMLALLALAPSQTKAAAVLAAASAPHCSTVTNVAAKVAAADPAADDRLKRLQDYQQFHIGIYMSLASAIIGSIVFASDKVAGMAPWRRCMLGLVIVFLLGAGACAAIAAVKLPEFTDYEAYRGSCIGVSLPWKPDHQWLPLRPAVWLSAEHLCFWIAVLSFAAFGIMAVLRPAGTGDVAALGGSDGAQSDLQSLTLIGIIARRRSSRSQRPPQTKRPK